MGVWIATSRSWALSQRIVLGTTPGRPPAILKILVADAEIRRYVLSFCRDEIRLRCITHVKNLTVLDEASECPGALGRIQGRE